MRPSNAPQVAQNQRPKFSVAITTTGYQNLIKNTLNDPKRAARFTAAITSAVAVNPALQDCEAGTILAGGLLGESLNLSPSPQLGQYYLVPFKQKAKYDRSGNLLKPACTNAQFVLGYKGLVQLAIRSGQYKHLNVLEIKEGELVMFDPLTEEINCTFIEDFDQRENAETIGYYAMFDYINGFHKGIYWSKQKMLAHADKYSAAFSAEAYKKLQAGEIPQNEMWKYSSFWYKNFDDMAKKTMIRQLISRWGVMSTELQQAFVNDGSVSEANIGTNEIITTGEELLVPADMSYEAIVQPEAVDAVEQVDLKNL